MTYGDPPLLLRGGREARKPYHITSRVYVWHVGLVRLVDFYAASGVDLDSDRFEIKLCRCSRTARAAQGNVSDYLLAAVQGDSDPGPGRLFNQLNVIDFLSQPQSDALFA